MDVRFHCDETRLFREGFAVRAFTYTDYSIDVHNHDFYEINVILAGEGTHHIENGKVNVRVGDVFVIPPMVAHAYTDTKELEVYHILLKKAFLEDGKEQSKTVAGYLRLMEIEPFLRSGLSHDCFLHLNQLQLSQLKQELVYLDDNGEFSWTECSVMKYHAVWKLLYWFSNLLDRQLKAQDDSTQVKREIPIMKALEYIHNHYDEKITIERLCQEVYVSRSTFLRHFQAITRTTPMKYLNDYRCKQAQIYLNKQEYSKTESAHRCGFFDLSHMERALKQYEKSKPLTKPAE